MVDVINETYESNVAETIVNSDKITQMNENYTEEGLDHHNLPIVTRKYPSKCKENMKQNKTN